MKVNIEIEWKDKGDHIYLGAITSYVDGLINDIKSQRVTQRNHISNDIEDIHASFNLDTHYSVDPNDMPNPVLTPGEDGLEPQIQKTGETETSKKELDNLFQGFSETFDDMLETIEEEKEESIFHQEPETEEVQRTSNRDVTVDVTLSSPVDSPLSFKDIKIKNTSFQLKAINSVDTIAYKYPFNRTPFDEMLKNAEWTIGQRMVSETIAQLQWGSRGSYNFNKPEIDRRQFIDSLSKEELDIFVEVSNNNKEVYESIFELEKSDMHTPEFRKLQEKNADSPELISQIRRNINRRHA